MFGLLVPTSRRFAQTSSPQNRCRLSADAPASARDNVPSAPTAQARRSFENLKAVCEAAGGSLGDIVRLGLYLTDLDNFAAVNAVMSEFFKAPYPARSTVEVAGLPRGARFEVDAVMVLD